MARFLAFALLLLVSVAFAQTTEYDLLTAFRSQTTNPGNTWSYGWSTCTNVESQDMQCSEHAWLTQYWDSRVHERNPNCASDEQCNTCKGHPMGWFSSDPDTTNPTSAIVLKTSTGDLACPSQADHIYFHQSAEVANTFVGISFKAPQMGYYQIDYVPVEGLPTTNMRVVAVHAHPASTGATLEYLGTFPIGQPVSRQIGLPQGDIFSFAILDADPHIPVASLKLTMVPPPCENPPLTFGMLMPGTYTYMGMSSVQQIDIIKSGVVEPAFSTRQAEPMRNTMPMSANTAGMYISAQQMLPVSLSMTQLDGPAITKFVARMHNPSNPSDPAWYSTEVLSGSVDTGMRYFELSQCRGTAESSGVAHLQWTFTFPNTNYCARTFFTEIASSGVADNRVPCGTQADMCPQECRKVMLPFTTHPGEYDIVCVPAFM